MIYKLGCKKDKRDNRDYLIRPYLQVVKMPAKIDYTEKMSPVRNQGNEGTCVGFACTAGMKEYQEFVDYGIDPKKVDAANLDKVPIMSPRFVYNECKKIDGYPKEEGTEIRIAMKVLTDLGACREKFWPYIPHDSSKSKFTRKQIFDDAKKFKELSYARILDLDELKMSLVSKGPCVIGIACFSGIMNTKTGIVPMPKRGEQPLGGHAICPVGYDDKKKLIKFKNSWSTAWGDKGYGYLPYAYIEKYMSDAWSTVDIDDPNPLTLASVKSYFDRVVQLA